MKVLITGSNGYVAKSLISGLKHKHDVLGINRSDFDLTNYCKTKDFFKNKHFDAVIHCAISGGNRLKKDSMEVLDNNLIMYYNLLDNRSNYDKFINIGSGAEIYSNDQPYGKSKRIISESISNKENFYNLRVYAVFDENELDTRFIKSNILRYIRKEPMIIHQDKFMDFFYMQDLVATVDHYICKDKPKYKEFECAYGNYRSLSDVANQINDLSDYKVKIIQDSKHTTDAYVARSYTDSFIDYVGLEKGIKLVYKKLI